MGGRVAKAGIMVWLIAQMVEADELYNDVFCVCHLKTIAG